MSSTALFEHFLAYIMHFKLFTCHLTPSPFDEFMMCRKGRSQVTFVDHRHSRVSFILVTNDKHMVVVKRSLFRFRLDNYVVRVKKITD